MNQDVQKYLSERAYENFNGALQEIEIIKAGIEDNRKGRVKLTDIQSHQDRLNRRMERESVGSLEADALERINGVPNFQDISILQKIMRMSEAVCRINIQNEYGSSGSGSGCLIGPSLLITNNHVFPNAETAANSLAQFRYQLDQDGNPMIPFTFNLRPDLFFVTSSYQQNGDPLGGLDYSIVAVESTSQEGKPLSEIPYVRLYEKIGKILDGESCVIIQHPKRDYKKIVLKDIRLLTLKDNVIWYESDTLQGSSGSIVIGLGTGDVVALHHSGVPRKNQFGQTLKKDGSVWQTGDADEDIDWMANEGIRISRILNNLQQHELSDDMSELRTTIFDQQEDAPINLSNTFNSPSTKINTLNQENNNSNSYRAPMRTNKKLLSFEILLSKNKSMQSDWKNNSKKLIAGLESAEMLFPHSTDDKERRYAYITVTSEEHPFEIANNIESLPQIDMCTPDLPMDTDIKLGHYQNYGYGDESYESMNRGVADWGESESKFKVKWANSRYAGDAIKSDPNADNYEQVFRNWSRSMVKLPFAAQKEEGETITLHQQITKWHEKLEVDISTIKIVQLDTGYTDHSKVKKGFDLTRDEDFIDGNDARDEMNIGIFKYPGHGTRTASIIIGNNQKEVNKNNANPGVLNNGKKAFVKVIPFRIAETPIVINKGRNVFQAVQEAIQLHADVIFMCMGSHPRPMIEQVVKKAYERGIIFVCAAGNYVEVVVAPALYPGTIAVGAVNPDGRPWKHSSYGDEVDICAPGEDVYVPFKNKKGDDIMVYGSGTSYATPVIASAAAMWKAKYKSILDSYSERWMVVEEFRYHLKETAQKFGNWKEREYGAGVIDFTKLLDSKPFAWSADPKTRAAQFEKQKRKLNNRYADYEGEDWDLGFREAISVIWRFLVRKITPGPESLVNRFPLTDRAKKTLDALDDDMEPKNGFESLVGPINQRKGEKLIKEYFKSFNTTKTAKNKIHESI